MKVRRSKGDICAIVYATGHAGRQIGGAAKRNHEVRKITAYTHALDQGVKRRGVAVAGVALEGDLLFDPVANRLCSAVAQGQVTKLLAGQRKQTVGLAVAAGVEVLQHIAG